MILSDEQKGPVLSSARRLLIRAGAGAGKTYTLEAYARHRPDLPMLYVTHNRAVMQSALRRLPSNVECRTAHSISFIAALRQFGPAKDQKIGDTRIYEIAKRFELTNKVAQAAWATLTAWMASADNEILERHVPGEVADASADRGGIVSVARNIWAAMIDKEDLDVRMPHDGYVKLFQLSKSIIRPGKGKAQYAVMLCDDFQDCNEALLDILARQSAQLVYAGDENQRILGERGGRATVERMHVDEVYNLTHCFRFGQPIADLANSLLGYFKQDHRPLVGMGRADPGKRTVDETKTFAIISRTNAGLFEKAASYLDRQVEFHFVGAPDREKAATVYRLNAILDAYRLWNGSVSEIEDRYIRRFKSFEELEKHANQTGDMELLYICRAIHTHRHRIPSLVEQILSRHVAVECVSDPNFVGIFLTTAQRSKGLQFGQVMLTDDYAALVTESGEPMPPEVMEQEEVNILYLAMTRAVEVLEINAGFVEFLIAMVGWEAPARHPMTEPGGLLTEDEVNGQVAADYISKTEADLGPRNDSEKSGVQNGDVPEWLLAEPPDDLGDRVPMTAADLLEISI